MKDTYTRAEVEQFFRAAEETSKDYQFPDTAAYAFLRIVFGVDE